MKIRGDLCVERRNLRCEIGHDHVRRQGDMDRSETVLADFGKCRSGSPASDFFHVALTPIEHEIIGSAVVALHGDKALVDGNRDGRNGEVADRSTGRKKESASGQEPR